MTDQKRENHFRFTENQLNVLETFHRRILKFLLYQLDDEFRIEPHPEANWTGLGHSMIRLLKQCDERPFEMIIQGVLHAILKAEPPQTNPYSAAAMADAGVTHNKIFEEVLETMRTHNGENGELPMGAKVLGRDDLFATLWNLRILHVSDRAKDHTSITEPAFTYLENEMEAILEDTPDMVARLMAADLCLRPDGQQYYADLIARLGRPQRILQASEGANPGRAILSPGDVGLHIDDPALPNGAKPHRQNADSRHSSSSEPLHFPLLSI